MVQKRRHLAKTITWRLSATLITAVTAWIVTGTFAVALAITSVDFVIKFGWYYAHERLWNRSKWGVK